MCSLAASVVAIAAGKFGQVLFVACLQSYTLMKGIMNLLPSAIAAEAAVVVIHCRPWRKVVRQHPPGAAGSHQIQNTVDHLPYVCCSWPPARFSWRQQRFKQLPLFVCQIAGVYFGIHTSVIGQKPTFRTLSQRFTQGIRVLCPSFAIPSSFASPGNVFTQWPMAQTTSSECTMGM